MAIPVSESTSTGTPQPVSKARRALTITGWSLLALSFLIFFTIAKLPDERLSNYLLGSLNYYTGVSITADKSTFSTILGPKFTLEGAKISVPTWENDVRVEKLSIAPSLLKLLFARMGGYFDIYQGNGRLGGDIWIRNPKSAPRVLGSFDSTGIDIGKMELLSALKGIKGTAVITGNGSFDLELANMATLVGAINLSFSKIQLDSFSIPIGFGSFTIPPVTITKGTLGATADKGKIIIKNFNLGGGPETSLTGQLTGEIILNKDLFNSSLSVKVANLRLSESLLKAFGGSAILDGFIGTYKQPDGSYTFRINGPIISPQMVPSS